MDVRIFTEPQQGATYDDLIAVALEAENLGFSAFFRSDHYLKMGSVSGLPGPTDAWTTLAGLARDTTTIRLGTLMTSATFRYPGVLAIQVAGVDQMSGGRVELGLGAGWFAEEHAAYGIPFPTSVGERFDRFEEQLEIITGMWSDTTGSYSFAGRHYQIEDSPALPKPTQPKLPLLIGGSGRRRTPALAVKYADEFNTVFVSLEDATRQYATVREFAEKAEREEPVVLSIGLLLCLGASEAETDWRAAAIGRDKAELREHGLAGTPTEVIEKIKAYEAAGASRLYLQVLDLSDLDHLRLFASEVMPQL